MADKIVHVIGCGPSGVYFPGPAEGELVIGVNDSWKWGHALDDLIFLNRPSQFDSDRLKTISNTRALQVHALPGNISHWHPFFPFVRPLPPLTRFAGKWKASDNLYHTDNSPFTAMDFAFRYRGATAVVLWGVDFVDHKYLKATDVGPAYSKYAISKPIYKGHPLSKLLLPVWKSQQ